MTLQVPELSVTAYMVFFVSKENKLLTTLTGLLGLIGLTIGIGGTLLLYKFTYGHPELRIPGMAIALFLGMWLSRVFVLGPLGFLIGFVVAVSQSVGEAVPSPELLVRGLLWLWVAIAYGAATHRRAEPAVSAGHAEGRLHIRQNQKALFVSDAFTNPAHVHFALKVTFAAMFCYIFYMAIDWSGIHTALITCTFIALESTDATLYKGPPNRRLRDRRSARAFHHRIPDAAHGNDRVARCARGLCRGHRGLGRGRKRTDQLCWAADRIRFLLQRLSRLRARHRSR